MSRLEKDKLFIKYMPMFMKIAKNYNYDDRYDLISDYYLKFIRQTTDFSKVDRVANYLSRSFRNNCKEFYSRQDYFYLYEDMRKFIKGNGMEEYLPDLGKEPIKTPEQLYQEKEIVARYKKIAKPKLHPARYKTFCAVVDGSMLHEEQSKNEAAKILGLTRNHVKVTMHEVMKRLNKEDFTKE